MKFQLLSDLHVEFPDVEKQFLDIPVNSKCLLLCGDIGSFPSPEIIEKFEKWILSQADRFEVVLFVSGNHEYYKSEFWTVQKQIKEIVDKRKNLHFLDNSSYVFEKEKIKVIGSTLWSKIDKDKHDAVYASLNDFKNIKIKKKDVLKEEEHDSTTEINERWLRIEDTDEFFEETIAYFKKEIAKSKENEEKVIILTHHAPLEEVIEKKYLSLPNTSAFYTDLSFLMGDPVVLFCYGHTHNSFEYVKNGTTVISNQLGYLMFNQQKKSGYHHGLVINVNEENGKVSTHRDEKIQKLFIDYVEKNTKEDEGKVYRSTKEDLDKNNNNKRKCLIQ